VTFDRPPSSTARFLAVLVVLVLSAIPTGRAQEPGAPSSPPDPVEALTRELDDRDETTAALRRTLTTLDGRVALAEALEVTGASIESERRRSALRALLNRYFEHSGNGATRPRRDAESFPTWLVERCREWKQDVGSLEGTVRELHKGSQETSALAGDLRTFLQREDAASQLYREFVRAKIRPDRMSLATLRLLEPDDEGRLVVPAAYRGAAGRALERDRAVSRAIDILRAAVPSVLERAGQGSPAHAALARELRDDVGLAVVLLVAGAGTGDPVEVALGLLNDWEEALPSDSPLAFRHLRDAADFRPEAEDALRSAHGYATRLRDDDPSLDGWRALLTSPRALLLALPRTRERPGPAEVLLDDTPFGRALVTENGTVRINRHARWDIDRLLQGLAKRSRELEPLREQIAEFASTLEPGELREALLTSSGQDVLVEASIREAEATVPDRFTAWVDRTFDRHSGRMVVRNDARDAVISLIDRAAIAGRELAAAGAHTSLAPSSLDYGDDGLQVLRSSVFYNPRTADGAWLYFTAFPDHHAVRLFGLFEWSVRTSTDPSSFVKNLERRRDGLKRLAATHDKLIVNINCVPAWLSSVSDRGTFEDGAWKNKETHPPRDIKVWKRLVRELALVVKDSGAVERYYEFWNEPDLEYWQGNLQEFFELYEHTALTLREVDPDAKIGCCAVNGWDGHLRGDGDSAPINYEYIRFATSRGLPLDFVSWHQFGRPVDAIFDAKAAYQAELRRNGVGKMPEFLVTEWSVAGRGTPYALPLFGESMLALFEAGVAAQTVSMWEEAHAKPGPGKLPPWGLITQQGERHATWYVHRFLDRLSRGSRGLATVRREEDGRTIVVSRKKDGIYDVLVWQTGMAPRLAEAVKALRAAGFPADGWKDYGTGDRFERALASGVPIDPRWSSAFEKAKLAYDRHPVQTERLALKIEGARRVEVLWVESVRTEHTRPPAAVLRNTVTVPLRRAEVVRLLLRVE